MRSSLSLLLALTLGSTSGPAFAHEHHADTGTDAGRQRSEHNCILPELKVTPADGRHLSLLDAIDADRPAMLNFIHISSTAVCPVTSQVFMQVRELAAPLATASVLTFDDLKGNATDTTLGRP